MWHRLFAVAVLVSVAGSAVAGVPSPSDRALKKLLIDAKTECDTPIFIAGTRGSLGGETGVCEDSTVEQLTFHRGAPVYVKLVSEDALSEIGPRQCMDIFKFQPPSGPTQYNLRETGPFSTKTSTICVRTQSGVTKIEPRGIGARSTGSSSVRSGR